MSKKQNSGLGKSLINKLKKKEFHGDLTAQFTQPNDERV